MELMYKHLLMFPYYPGNPSMPPITTDIPPNQTLFIKNIDEKLKKDKLRRYLYLLFSQFGKILDVVACRGLRLRGKVSIIFIVNK